MGKRSNNGFTLIELMIVVAIIGVLAGVAIPAYGSYVKRAKFSEVVAATSAIKLAVELCYQKNDSLTVCDDNTTDNGSISDSEVAQARTGALNGGYIDAINVIYVNASHLTIAVKGNSEVDDADYHLKGVPKNRSLVWGLDENSSTCDEKGVC